MSRCERCHGPRDGGLWADGLRLCCDCADVAAFWPTINGDPATPCEGCGVGVLTGDACYLMAAVACPSCFVAVAS